MLFSNLSRRISLICFLAALFVLSSVPHAIRAEDAPAESKPEDSPQKQDQSEEVKQADDSPQQDKAAEAEQKKAQPAAKKNEEPAKKKEKPAPQKKEEPAKKPPAKPNNAKLTYTNPDETDADFAIQGEYVGQAAWPGRGRTTVGLQVVAQGDGKFNGVLYRGGLPGDGWDRSERVLLDGGRVEYGVQLVGYLGSVLIQNSGAQFYNAQGSYAGTLSKTVRVSPTMGAWPAENAVVLFNEHDKNLDHWNNAKLTKEGYLHSGTLMKQPVGDFRMHLEFRTPYMPYARGQGRGNSGVYIQQRYEVQVLDSFGLEGVENECGSLYRQVRPDVNMALPPLTWQTYDIYFTAARWSEDGKTKVANARLTLFHNGVAVHYNREIETKTGAGKQEGPEEFPINIQDHGNPVALRNVWIVFGDSGASSLAASTCNPTPSTCVCTPRRRR